MLKKLLCFLIIFLILLLNVCYATDIVMNAETQTTDNTLYTPSIDENLTENLDSFSEQSSATTTTTEYEDEAELSISNIINIVLISIGIVLVLLGIAIIIKLK